MGYYSLDEKYGLITRLIDLAKSDDVVNIAEISYLFWTSQQLQITDLELQNLMHKPVQGSLPFSLPERVEIFHKCITLIMIDSEVNSKELSKCEQIAKDMRLPETETRELFEHARTTKNQIPDLQFVKKVFKCG